MESIFNKHILITGATGGIGSQLASLLAASGAQLFISGRNTEKLQTLAIQLGLSEDRYFAGDLTQTDQVQALQQQYFKVFPKIDILINAAGIGMIKPFEQLSEADFLQTLHSNLYSPFLILQSFLPAMKEAKKGLIIHIPGILGKVPMAGAASYCASKYGLVGMLQSIREELKRTEIRITQVYLGGSDTDFWNNIDLRVQREKMIQAKEAAKAIWFLCQQPTSGVVNEMVLQPFNHQAI
ncbi:MAG: hypothetical protein RLY16_1079 [Bacteroidota bacterium]|jgi:short-subunit dehydrogenase